MTKKIKVIVIDDSKSMCSLLTEILSQDPDIEVVDVAYDPLEARDKIKAKNPDVITLDVEMPKMDGITFLKNIMRLRPMPVVMVSSFTQHAADITLEALQIGAVDFFPKPKFHTEDSMRHYAQEIINKVKMAAHAKLKEGPTETTLAQTQPKMNEKKPSRHLIAIGASTGGTEAIKEILTTLPPNAWGIVITQHIPPLFSASFADCLNRITALKVKEAQDDELILQGHAYVAPGGHHLKVQEKGGLLYCQVNQDPPYHNHRPSVDVLFHSIAAIAAARTVGVILTGMGADGAEGLKAIHDAGGYTIAQDEHSSVVWGMPAVAIKLQAVDTIKPLSQIASLLIQKMHTL